MAAIAPGFAVEAVVVGAAGAAGLEQIQTVGYL